MTRRDRITRFFIGLAAIAALVCVTEIAHAQVACTKIADNKAHVCWAAPTVNTDGSPIVLAITYTVQHQTGSTWTNDATNLTATDWTSGVLAPGSYNYRVIATVAGVSSDPAIGAPPKVVPNPVPNPPSGVVIAQVTITITCRDATSCGYTVAQVTP